MKTRKAFFAHITLIILLLSCSSNNTAPQPKADVSFSETFLDFGESASEQSVMLINSGDAPAPWEAVAFIEADDNPESLPEDFEIFVDPVQGTVPAGGSEEITVSLDRSSWAGQGSGVVPALASGKYQLAVVFIIDGADQSLSLFFEVIESPPSPPENRAPVANDDSYTLNQGETLSVDIENGVLANDTDADGDELEVISLVTDVSHGTLDLRAGGHFTYTHDGSAATTDSFSYTVGDGEAESNVATVTFLASTSSPPPPPSNGDYSIALEFLGAGFTPTRQAVFQNAATRWAQVITGDLSDISLAPGDIPANEACGFDHPAIEGTIDDLLILASITPIDGSGGTLGQAGPSFTRNSDGLTVIGCMEFDSDDIAEMEADGSFGGVILHEMGHVLGIGTRWEAFDLLLSDPDCDDATSFSVPPQFTGEKATAEFATLGGSGNIPVEDEHGGGTRCGHWDEDVFDHELMTGFAEGSNPLPMSRMTIASLADMGYAVDYSSAEAYSIPACAPNCDAPGLRAQGFDSRPWEVLTPPIGTISESGEVSFFGQ